MSEPIGKGDWVEYCPDGLVAGTGEVAFKRGAVHQVAAVGFLVRGCDGVLRPGLELATVPNPRPGARRKGATTRVSVWRVIYRDRDAKALTAKLLEGARSVPAQTVERRSGDTIKEPVGSLSNLRRRG